MKNIIYRQVGDYLIPNIKLAVEDKQPIGKYDIMRKDYLYNNKRVYFNIIKSSFFCRDYFTYYQFTLFNK